MVRLDSNLQVGFLPNKSTFQFFPKWRPFLVAHVPFYVSYAITRNLLVGFTYLQFVLSSYKPVLKFTSIHTRVP